MEDVTSHAVDKLIDGVDMVFGQDWFLANKVIINYAKMTCTIRTFGNSKHTIYPLSRGTVIDHNPTKALAYLKMKASVEPENVSCDVISAKRAVKSLVKGMDYMILMVRHCPAAGEKTSSTESANRNGTDRHANGTDWTIRDDLPPDIDTNGLIYQTGNTNVSEGQLGGNQQSTPNIAMVAMGLKHKNLSHKPSQERLQTQLATDKVPSKSPNGETVVDEYHRMNSQIKDGRP
jgi:hypothetical protein